jgi:hypothetical protein
MRDTKAAFVWIVNILTTLNVPFQIVGGLAAKAYGVNRDLWDIDIDIPEDKFALVKPQVNDFVIFGPARIKEKPWDVVVMTLKYQGQAIDLGSDRAKIFNQLTGEWHQLNTDFAQSVWMELYGLQVPVISRQDLIAYKKILGRAVDLADIALL